MSLLSDERLLDGNARLSIGSPHVVSRLESEDGRNLADLGARTLLQDRELLFV